MYTSLPRRDRRHNRRRDERGAVTAETAIALPAIAAIAVGLAWMIGLGMAQIKVIDAARESARLAARGETVAVAEATGRRVAGPRSTVSVRANSADQVSAVARANVAPPGGLFRILPTVRLEARAVAHREPGS